jgi:EmrB/QacA subfamily drug resistance transporter
VTRSQRLALGAAILGSSVASIDATIVNVALPSIVDDLGGGLSSQQWVSNAYLLALGSLILIGGSLGDIYGERRIFALGVGLFGVFSVATALAPTIDFLIVARALQGASAALLTPASLAIIVSAFHERERGPAIGTWMAWGAVAGVIGPLAGGLIVDQLTWRWVFALNIPVVIATLVLIRAGVPRSTHVANRRVDLLGAGLCTLGLGGVVFAFIEQPQYGWSAITLVPLAGGIAALAAFVLYEHRAPQPMLKLDLFMRRNFAIGNLQTLTMYGGLAILFFFLVIYLQQVAGYSALKSGLATLPTTVTMFVLSKRFGALADRHGPRFFMGAGPMVAAVGILLLVLTTGIHVSYLRDLVPPLVVFSVGLAMTVSPLTAAVLADADDSDAGIASAINNAVARVAGLLAVSFAGIVVASRLVGDTFAPNSESVSAFHVVLVICAILVAVGGVIGAIGITNPRRIVLAEQCPGGQLVGAPEPAMADVA